MAGLDTADRAPGTSTRSTRRPEIEGLRGLAAVLVVVYHVWIGRVSGGVDVFFLLSGFFILGMTARSAMRGERIVLATTWTRLFWRLVPTAGLVLAVSTVAAAVLLPASTWSRNLHELVASAFFVENWRLALDSVDYYADNGAASVAQHFWSLSIQAQFYLLAPLVVLAVAGWARSRGADVRAALLASLVAIALGSFAHSVIATSSDQAFAYFDARTRIWEFALGGVLALVIDRIRLGRRARAVLGWVGVAGLVTCGAVLDVGAAFPGYLALWPVLSAVAIIVAGRAGGADRLLSTRAAQYVGRISFPLYLWHWPVVVLLGNVVERESLRFYALALVLTLALSVTSYYLIEDAVRGSGWLLPGPRKPARSLWETQRLQAGWVALSVVVAFAAGAAAYARARTEPPETQQTLPELVAEPVATDAAEVATPDALLDTLQDQLQESIDAKRFPKLVPGPDDFNGLPADRVDWTKEPCVPAAPSSTCLPGDGSAGTVVVLGDSMALYWSATVRKAFAPYGYAVIDRSRSACPIIELDITDVESEGCRAYRTKMLKQVEREKPDVVVVSALYYDITLLETDASGTPAEQWTAAESDVLDRLTKAAGHVLVMSAPPESKDPQECITKFASPDDCETTISDVWRSTLAADEAAAQGRAKVTFVDTSSWVCSIRTSICPAFANGMVIRRDLFHLTFAYAEYVSPLLAEIMVADGVLPPASG